MRSWGAPDGSTKERFLRSGIPVVRLANIFIAQEAGPSQLRVGQPANVDFSRIPALPEAPDCYERNRRARETGRYFEPPVGARPSPPARASLEFAIDPDRDVNAAGLVYFGNFPAFFHAAERHALAALPPVGLPRRFVDRRGTLRRRIGLFANASGDDRLRVQLECAIQPEPATAGTPPRSYGLMWFSLRVERCSDGRLVAITTAERCTPLATTDDVGCWRDYAGQMA
jgi:probable biosynthetic protein (TIGR04098 family)